MPKGPGRPTKRNEERVNRLLTALKVGNTRKAACIYGGISQDTFAYWLANFSDFADQVNLAENEAEMRMVGTLQKAASEREVKTVKKKTVTGGEAGPVTIVEETTKKEMDWRASVFWLERRRKAEWAQEKVVSLGATVHAQAGPVGSDTLADLIVTIAANVASTPVPTAIRANPDDSPSGQGDEC